METYTDPEQDKTTVRIADMWMSVKSDDVPDARKRYIARLAFQAQLAEDSTLDMLEWMNKYNTPFREMLEHDENLIKEIIDNHDSGDYRDSFAKKLEAQYQKSVQ